MLLQSDTALVAFSNRWNQTVAVPRLTPPGPYAISAFLTGPHCAEKYSYLSQGLVSELGFVQFDYTNRGNLDVGIRYEKKDHRKARPRELSPEQ